MVRKDVIVVTNNPLTEQCLPKSIQCRCAPEMSHRDVLVLVRDMVHKNHKLLTHPLAGSVKPNETPYRSILLTSEGTQLCAESVDMMSAGIEKYDTFVQKNRQLTEETKLDFMMIDFILIAGALRLDAQAILENNKDFVPPQQ